MNKTISMTKEYYLTSLEQASTYFGEGQYAEAIAILEPLVNSDISDIQGVIAFCLGDSYKCLGSSEDNMRAKEYLSRAIELASVTEDNQLLVAAKATLAQLETVLGEDRSVGVQSLLFQACGDCTPPNNPNLPGRQITKEVCWPCGG